MSDFHVYPEWANVITNHYWHLRIARKYDSARIRKEYRCIVREKKRLHEEGLNPELVRLFCRHMVNPKNSKAEARFWNFHFSILEGKDMGSVTKITNAADKEKKLLAFSLTRIYDGLTSKLVRLEFENPALYEAVKIDMGTFENLVNELNGFS